MSIIDKLFGGLKLDLNKAIDDLTTTKEEKRSLKIQMDKALRNHKKSMYELEVEDRKSARDMYKDDSVIQKILATIFTLAYFTLSFVLARYFLLKDINLGEFEISFISTLFGAMSAKINTIIDFYYGTGSNKDNK
tara:strand:+ start:22402 stop:22806 length:405 start_codon:yes stop_codon:yes gene_type:complete